MDAHTKSLWLASPTRSATGSFGIKYGNGYNLSGPHTKLQSYESLSGYRGKRWPNSMHPCTHVQEKWSPLPISLDWYGQTYTGTDIPAGLGGGAPLGMAYDTSMGAKGAAQLRTQLAGGMSMGASLPLFLIEAGQTVSIIPQILASAARLAAITGPKVIKEIGFRTIKHASYAGRSWELVGSTNRARTFLREAANTHLLEAFGISPLIQDIRALWNTGEKVHEHLKRLKAMDQKSWTSFSAAYSPGSLELTPPSFWTCGQVRDVSQEIMDSGLSCRVHAWTRPNGPLPQDTLSRLAHQYQGMVNPFGVLYELKAFSFALDWVLPMGDLMTNLDSAIAEFGTEPFLQTRRLCWTARAHATRKFSCQSYLGIPSGVELGILTQKAFERGLGVPNYKPEGLTLSGLGFRQAALSTSLILQRL